MIIYHIVSWIAMWPAMIFLGEENTDDLLRCFFKIRRLDLAKLHIRNSIVFLSPFFIAVLVSDIFVEPIGFALIKMLISFMVCICMQSTIIVLSCINQPSIQTKLILIKYFVVAYINLIPLGCVPLLVIYTIANRKKMLTTLSLEE
jgi:hypothetical protein